MSESHRCIEVLDVFRLYVDRDQRIERSLSGNHYRYPRLSVVIGCTPDTAIGSSTTFYNGMDLVELVKGERE